MTVTKLCKRYVKYVFFYFSQEKFETGQGVFGLNLWTDVKVKKIGRKTSFFGIDSDSFKSILNENLEIELFS